jgi:carboxymethylenebutenolidase
MPRSKTTLRTTDGVMNTQRFTPAGAGPWPGAILYVDAFGVRPATESMAERLASAGYYVLLPDIFYRSQPIAPFDPAEVFKGGPERERLMALIQTTTAEKVMQDTAVCLDYMDTESRVAGGIIGVTGYCMGGRLAMTAAGIFPDRVAAAGIFHAGGLATDSPASPHLLAPKIRARLYIAIAAIDQNFSDAERERLKQALDAAGVQYAMEVYPEVAHGFCVPGLPVFNTEASERHWRELLHLFGEALPAGVPATA